MIRNQFKQPYEGGSNIIYQPTSQLSSLSYSLIQEVLRKNNEIVMGLLNRFAEVQASIILGDIELEEDDAHFSRIENDISKLNEGQKDFQQKICQVQFQAERRESRAANDLSTIKSLLTTYDGQNLSNNGISSKNFKSNLDEIIPKSKLRSSVKDQSRNSINWPKKSRLNINQGESGMDYSETKSIIIEKEILSFSQQFGNLNEHQQLTLENQLVQVYIKRQELEEKLLQLKASLCQKLANLQQKTSERQNQALGLNEICRHIDQALLSKLANYPTKDFLQKSLQNLKQAWQYEQNQLYIQLNSKASICDISNLRNKIDSLSQQMNAISFGLINKSSSMNQSLILSTKLKNESCMETKPKKQNGLVENRQKDTQRPHHFRNSSSTSNSIRITDGRQLRRKPNANSLEEGLNEEEKVFEKNWKDRVGEILGNEKSKRSNRYPS